MIAIEREAKEDVRQYEAFLETKRMRAPTVGITLPLDAVHPLLFPFQRDIVRWALRKGRAAVFADCGLGKTFIQLEWARLLGGRTLIIAPLSVARQTVREGCKLGIDVHYTRSVSDVVDGINITNYDIVRHFDASIFGAVVLDESSLLKSVSGSTRHILTDMFADTPYRLCCTATPAPNDYVELGNHAEFLGICTEAEMRAMFFINANKEHTIVLEDKVYRRKGSNKAGQEWRLKHAAERPFFHWLASWAFCLTTPSDLGYDDDGFILPPLEIVPHFVEAEGAPAGQLFFTGLHGIEDRVTIRRQTLPVRLTKLKQLLVAGDEQWIVWVGLDEESKAAAVAIPGAIEVKGSDSPEQKAAMLEAFQDGKYRVLVSKVKIAGFGMNMQQAHHMAFLGLSDSWESWYQAIRREWRFGQRESVQVHAILSDYEAEIWQNVMRKDAMAMRLRRELIAHVRDYEGEELAMRGSKTEVIRERTVRGANWTAMQGDSCERLKEIADNSIDLSAYSPPFADLFTYTDSPRDLGNSRGWSEFFLHYGFIVREVLRVTKPGRLTCVHAADVAAMLERDGYIGIRDFPGEVIRAHEREGWIYHGRTAIDKNPQAQALRTHAKNLLFAQLEKDSCWSRSAIADYILVFRKPGLNAVPVQPVANGDLNRKDWILWARPIWYAADYAPGSFQDTGRDDYKSGAGCPGGIRETDTLQFAAARGADDEKHICPLQLGTIERCIKLYSNPGEIVLSPFMGIGSEGYQAVRFRRRFVGCELKESYFDVAVRHLRQAEGMAQTPDLFSL